MTFKKCLFIGLCLITVFATWPITASANHYRKEAYVCYSGSLSNADAKDIRQVRVAVPKDPEHSAYILIFITHRGKYTNDIYCKKNRVGRCNIVDDGGSFEILKFTQQQMVIQFNEKPGIRSINGSITAPTIYTEITPWVDIHTKLKSPIRMTLTPLPSIECSY